MADIINVDPDNLHAAALLHQDVADHLRAVPKSHAAIEDSLNSLGPIFAELRQAGRDLLEQRRLCYEQQANDHAGIAQTLSTAVAKWDDHEAKGVARFRDVGGEP
jgi:hypothetical protein